MQLIKDVQYSRLYVHARLQCRQSTATTLPSNYFKHANSSSIKIRNNNSLNYSQTIRTDHQLKHCLR